jgi:endonuclease III
MDENMKPQKPKKLKLVSQAIVTEIFSRFEAVSPEPKGELNYVNPFTLLVAVVLSAQATDIGVNKATKALFAVADTPQKMLALGEERVRDYVKTIGLFRAKAKNVITLCEQLLRDHDGEVPQTCDELIKLAGVGRKTANVVLNMAFGHKTMAVDTHVFRVSNRIPLFIGTTPEQIEAGLMKRIPTQFMMHAHHWLILHGRYICKARKPECGICPINDVCQSKILTL